jgi:serine/threonine protein phosphatase PrpC
MNHYPTPSGEHRENISETILVGGASLVHEGHPDRNEDSYIADPTQLLVGVFDGVGGRPGSEVASRLAAQTVVDEARQFPAVAAPQQAEELLSSAVETAHNAVLGHGDGRIGTTAAVAKVFHDEMGRPFVGVASVADSRVYLYRQGELSFLSYDKGRDYDEASPKTISRQRNLATVVEPADVAALSISSQIAFRRRNLITSMMGQADSTPIITTYTVPLQTGDIILAATDGIHDNLTHGEIAAIIADARTPDEATDLLTQAARERSRDRDHLRAKPDDMTAVALYYDVV